MSTTKYVYLFFVDSKKNHNKYYKMIDNGNGTWTAFYGREGSSEQKASYSMGEWDKKYREKIKKGYEDITELRAVKTVIKEAKDSSGKLLSKDKQVASLIEMLQGFAKAVTSSVYKVEAKEVTQAQIDKAQEVLDELTGSLKYFGKNFNIDSFNKVLERLFLVIPRKMKRVADELISSRWSKKEIEALIMNEQSNIDAMSSQVVSNDSSDEDEEENKKEENTLLEDLGLQISLVTDSKILKEVKSLAQNHAHRIINVYAVTNNETQKEYDLISKKIKNRNNIKLLWHGSRAANWFSIIQQGLKIRPSNAVYTGSMWDDGVYFASESDKSMGYTDSGRWVNGGKNINRVFMALYEVNLGNQLIKERHDSSSYKIGSYCKQNGFDSVWAKKGVSLYRDEFIIYNHQQSTIKYLVEFSN